MVARKARKRVKEETQKVMPTATNPMVKQVCLYPPATVAAQK